MTLRERIDTELARHADKLPHPRELTTPKGYTPYGKMKTPVIQVMLYAAIMYSPFTTRMVAMVNPSHLKSDEAAIYEGILVTTEDGSDPDPVKIFRYVQENYPTCKYKMTSQLIYEVDMWNLHDEVIEQVIRQYKAA